MTTSDNVSDLATALAKAQGEMGGAKKDAANPFFKSKYADLASVRDACIGPLTKHGLAILQSPSTAGSLVSVETMLLHTSGQWIKGEVSCTAKDDSPQSVGSAITYLRRYALQSFAGVAPEDDDGEAAQGRGNGKAAKPDVQPTEPSGYQNWLTDMQAVADEGTERLRAEWKAQPEGFRTHLITFDVATYEALRQRAKTADANKKTVAA